VRRNEQHRDETPRLLALREMLAEHAPTLAHSDNHSQTLLAALASALNDLGDTLAGIEAVIAAGSLGRLEAHATSDFDGIVLAAADGPPKVPAAVFETIAALGLRPPKADGIYRDTVTLAALCSPRDRGSLEEPPARFGKRMQLLLDARAVWGEAAFLGAQREVLDWYAGDYLAVETEAQWTLLLNDWSRYLHAYAGWQQHKRSHTDDDSWYLRQAKLRSSRVLTFAGLLFLLGDSSTRGLRKVDWVHAQLALTPVERVGLVMTAYDEAGFRQVLADYECIHRLLSAPEVRDALVALGPPAEGPLPARFPEPYAEIHARSGSLMRGLSRFVLARQTDWHPDFFSYLLF
jgi:hypothetical protein